MVVIGNGMVGHRFCERLAAYDANREFEVVTFCEEPRPAYDRVNNRGRLAHIALIPCSSYLAPHSLAH